MVIRKNYFQIRLNIILSQIGNPMQEKIQQVNQTYYIMSFGLFNSHDIELLCAYKQFVQSTIIELGEDWRIQSGLLSQEIVSGASQTMSAQADSIEEKLQFNIFNEFLLPFLKKKVGFEREVCQTSDSTIQQQYSHQLTKYFYPNSKLTESLTFNTLSLGFCIKAIDMWVKNFSHLQINQKQELIFSPLGILNKHSEKKPKFIKSGDKSSMGASTIRHNLSNIQIGSCQQSSSQMGEQKNYYEENIQKKWIQMKDLSFFQIEQLKGIQHSLRKAKYKKVQLVSIFAANIHEMHINCKKIRVMSINSEFYRNAFIVWLIFNIKLFFSITFEQYLLYFKNLFQNWESNFEIALKKFFIIIEKQWNLLLKDYSVALHDDLQVLKSLINRVRNNLYKLWEGKQQQICKKLCN